jgi:hypothetical protein
VNAFGPGQSNARPIPTYMYALLLGANWALLFSGMAAAPQRLQQGGSGIATVAAAAPTQAALMSACPEQTRACLTDQQCALFMPPPAGDSNRATSSRRPPASGPGQRPPPLFVKLVSCFQASAHGEARREDLADTHRRVRRAASDVQCDFCVAAVEELWSMMLHRPAETVDAHSVEDTLLMLLNNMCSGGPDGAMVMRRWQGMFDIRQCTPANVSSGACRGGGTAHRRHNNATGRHWALVREPGPGSGGGVGNSSVECKRCRVLRKLKLHAATAATSTAATTGQRGGLLPPFSPQEAEQAGLDPVQLLQQYTALSTTREAEATSSAPPLARQHSVPPLSATAAAASPVDLVDILPEYVHSADCSKECPEPSVMELQALSDAYEKELLSRGAEPRRQWHAGVYHLLCAEQLLPLDVEIVAAFNNQQPREGGGGEQQSVMRAEKRRVAQQGCANVCQAPKPRKPKHKKRKQANKRRKKQRAQ